MRGSRVLSLALAWTCACDTAHEKPAPAAAKPVSASSEQKSPEVDVEAVLDFLLQFAKKMLEKNGEFYPFGATMMRDGSIAAAGYMDDDDHPQSQRVIDGLLTAYRTGAKTGSYRAVGLAYAITTLPPGATEKSDAIAVRLDHVDGSSVVVVYPYRIVRPGEVVVGEPYKIKGAGDVFPAR